jgi:hypothetical protein
MLHEYVWHDPSVSASHPVLSSVVMQIAPKFPHRSISHLDEAGADRAVSVPVTAPSAAKTSAVVQAARQVGRRVRMRSTPMPEEMSHTALR